MTDHGLLGGTLKKWRLSKQLTLQQLADQSGVSRAAISKIERGDSGASSSVVGKLSEALDVSISQLMGGQMRDKVVHIAAEKQPVFTEKRTGFERQSLSPLYLGKGVDFIVEHLLVNAVEVGAVAVPLFTHLVEHQADERFVDLVSVVDAR